MTFRDCAPVFIMKFPFIKHPQTGTPDVMTTVLLLATIAAVVKFLLDGVTIELYGHTISLGHVDSFSYGSLLAPIFGSHGYMSTRPTKLQGTGNVDNPDA